MGYVDCAKQRVLEAAGVIFPSGDQIETARGAMQSCGPDRTSPDSDNMHDVPAWRLRQLQRNHNVHTQQAPTGYDMHPQ